jgi:3-oxoadipate enol-lactonase
MMYADHDGVRIAYRVDGPEGAPAIVLSNSMGCTMAMWEPQIAALTERYRVIRYDRRGHGASDAPDGDYTIALLAEEAIAVVDAAGVDKAHWCGLSIGAMTGLWLATHNPERIGRLVAASCAVHMPPADIWNGRIRMAKSRGTAPLAEPTMKLWFTDAFRAENPDAVERVRADFATTATEGFCGCCAAMRDMDQRKTIRAISQPVLVIAGSDDTGTTATDAAAIIARVPDARGLILKASHILNVERAANFNRALLDFLD